MAQAQQYDELHRLLPHLCPTVQPRSLADVDLRVYLRGASPSAVAAFAAATAEMARSSSRCAICGAPGSAVAPVDDQDVDDDVDDDDDDDDDDSPSTSDALRFTTVWRLDFDARTCQLTKGEFCCGLCRACLDVGSFVRFTALRAGRDERWSDLSDKLARHLVAVNQMDSITGDAARAALVQQAYNQAYSLSVLASSLPNWRLVGPDGAAVDHAAPDCVALLATACLNSQNQPKKLATKVKARPTERRKRKT